ncbi:hypothetical protein [Luteimonas kalidii]|uniref:Uncharacterized protein n=1 Tax=Luteimonas kalidii TaxID=3042025 RepID=A0ABT6JYY7_9GAMM|nr:hypothetical protein [Luteimonas kalidii]MDH5835221.1 hypothetical protein [Luteimonas kalidii]
MTPHARLILLLLCLCASRAGASEPWQGLRHGMTPEQVQQRFPQAKPPAEPDTLAGGAIEGLRLPGATLAGHPATVAYFFGHEGLVQASATLDDRLARADGMQAFEAIVRELAATHGAPHAQAWTHEPWQRRSMEWRVEGIPLRVLYSDMGETSLVKLIWQARRPDAPPPPRLELPAGAADR